MTTEGRQGLCFTEKRAQQGGAIAGKVGRWDSCGYRHHPQGLPSSFLPGPSIL